MGFIVTIIIIAGNNALTSNGRTEGDNNGEEKYASVFLDDKLLVFSNKPIIVQDKIYVSIKEYGEFIGAEVKFKGNKKIIIKKNEKNLVINTKDNIAITEKNDNFFINRIYQGKKSLLPIDVISEHFGFDVSPISEDAIKIYTSLENDQENLEDSGEQIQEEQTEEIDQSIAKIKPGDIEADPDKKIAYLTFDDGPNDNTPAILDILKENDIKATFFMLGSSIKEHKDITKRISDEGHALGVHSMTHDFETIYESPDSFMHEMTITNDALKEATGKQTQLLRAPYGSKPYMREDIRDLATSWGYRIWDWNIDSKDSLKKDTTADEVYNQVVNRVTNYNHAVILFHDKEHTVEALPRILEFLNSQGFEIGKLDTKMKPLNFWNDHR